MQVRIELCKIVVWVCLVRGLHSEGERVECKECWRCGGGRARRPTCPLHMLAYRLAGQGRAAGTTLHVPHWMSQKNETSTLNYVCGPKMTAYHLVEV